MKFISTLITNNKHHTPQPSPCFSLMRQDLRSYGRNLEVVVVVVEDATVVLGCKIVVVLLVYWSGDFCVSGDFSFGRSRGGDGGYDVFLCLLLFMILKRHIWWQLW